jgi:SecD/SecF fusion protein
MPLKGLVKFLTIALILVCIFQLSIGYFVKQKTSEIETRATKKLNKEYPTATAKYPNDAALQKLYTDTLNAEKEKLFISEEKKAAKENTAYWLNYRQAKDAQLRLGLDLQGGMSVTLEVAVDELIKKESANKNDPNLLKAIEAANKRKANSNANFIKLFREEFEKIVPNGSLAALYASGSNNKLAINSTNAQVESYLTALAKDAFKTNYGTLQKRLDGLGQGSAQISPDEASNTITVEMPGVRNPEDMKAKIRSSASLEMWEVQNPTNEMIEALKKADELYLADSTTSTTNRKKFDEILKIQGGNRIGGVAEEDAEFFKERIKSAQYQSVLGTNTKLLMGKPEEVNSKTMVPVYAIATNGDDKAPIRGAMVSRAEDNRDQATGKPEVILYLNKEGERIFDEMAAKLYGRGSIAVVLDETVYSAPTINAQRFGGVANISGSMSVKEAQELASVLNNGKLSAPMRIVQDDTVGASIGDDSIKGGFLSFVIAFLVIFILMLVYYNTAGWVANIALIANLLFTIGALSMLGFTLTAPGIAGLVLTIGMAVDTNVIIFERIKEELEKGKDYAAAVAEGYKRSLAPVLDAHFTTFLTAAILFYFGIGPVKGFGTTQMLGIVLSLFCGILLSRLITDWYTNKNRHFNYFTPLSRRIFKHAQFKFIEYRKVTYIISLVVLLLGVAAIFNGFDTGVEYSGGRSYKVNFGQSVKNTDDIRSALTAQFGGKTPVVRSIKGSDEMFEITTSYLKDDSRNDTIVDGIVKAALFTGAKKFMKADITAEAFAKGTNNLGVISKKVVSPSISDDLKKGAQKAAIFSILIIALYIFIRFRDWRYSLGTIVALLHDVFVTLAVFSFLKHIMPFPLELDQHFIAAVLTVIGFSMNDTIIVFDRVRENAKKMQGESKAVIINKSINETLSRTIMTSLTVFLTILILFIFGGDVTRGFAFAMLVGVIVGTYSSIFVAAPILVDFAKNTPLGEADFVDHSNDETAKAEAAIR